MIKKFNSCIFKIIGLYLGIPALIALCLYKLLPIILNYPPDSIDNVFQMEFDGITYTQQYALLISIIVSCSLIILFIRAYRIHHCLVKLSAPKILQKETIDILLKVRRFCYDTPYLLYVLEILLPLIFLPVTFIIIKAYPLTILKICLAYLSFFTLASVTSFVFSKNKFGYIINLLNEKYPELMQNIEQQSTLKRSNIKSLTIKLILQFMPLVIVSLIFLSLVGYVQAAKKTGDVYYTSYLTMFSNNFNKTFDSIEDVRNQLSQITLLDNDHQYFIIYSDGNYETADNSSLEAFFIKYVLDNSEKEGGRTFDYFCLDTEGVTLKCNLSNGDYCYVGIRYDTTQPEFLKVILISDILLFKLIFSILLYVSHSLSSEIKTVASRLK